MHEPLLDTIQSRREALERLAALVGGAVLVPSVSACGSATKATASESGTASGTTTGTGAASTAPKAAAAPGTPPIAMPPEWDPVAYNMTRGNAGAIPDSYLPSINGPDGVPKHLGKHLPYVPKLSPGLVPDGFIAIMWGDPAKGYAKHPNAPKSESNPDGHWYNWIKIRLARRGDAEEVNSEYSDWPGTTPGDNGAYVVFGGGDITAESGKNTVYLAALPGDVRKGDTVRIWAHCLTHGEYVDFLTI